MDAFRKIALALPLNWSSPKKLDMVLRMLRCDSLDD